MYLADPHADVFRAYGVLVVTIADDRIGAITGFDASVMSRFGLPRTHPGTDRTNSSARPPAGRPDIG